MRKILTKLVTLLVITTLAVSSLVGCGLITTNNDRDMAQVVAEVNISTDNEECKGYKVDTEEILKSEMIAGFLSYGYMYVQSYGYTVPAAYEMVLKNLTQNKIIVQQARIQLAILYNNLIADTSVSYDEANPTFNAYFKKTASINAKDNGTKKIATEIGEFVNAKEGLKEYKAYLDKVNENLKGYLSEYEIAQAVYSVKVSVNSMIDQYVEEDEKEDDHNETEKLSPRKAPEEEAKEQAKYEFNLKTGDTSKPTEYDYKKALVTLKKADSTATLEGITTQYTTLYDLNKAVFDKYEIDVSTAERRKAFNKAVKALKNNGVMEKDEKIEIRSQADAGKVFENTYFLENLKNQFETALVSKYEQSLISVVEANMTDDAVADQYMAEYEAQKSNYTGDLTAYESALDAATKDKFVVYNPFMEGGKNGYGYVANLLIGFTEEQTAELKKASDKAGATQETILNARNDLLKNLMVKDQRESWVYASYGDLNEGKFTFDKKYRVNKDLDSDLLYTFNGTVYGAKSVTDKDENDVEETKWTFKNVVATPMTFDSFVNDYLSLVGISKKIYGTDAVDGTTVIDLTANRSTLDDLIYAFSTDPGSLGNYNGYTYSPFTSDTKYVKEFAEASAAVVKQGEGAYTIVATDFGYHVIVCTKQITSDPYTTADAFKADINNKDKFAYTYKEMKLAKITNDEVGKIANKFINDYMENKVTHFEKTYKDLIPDAGKEDSSANA